MRVLEESAKLLPDFSRWHIGPALHPVYFASMKCHIFSGGMHVIARGCYLDGQMGEEENILTKWQKPLILDKKQGSYWRLKMFDMVCGPYSILVFLNFLVWIYTGQVERK